MLLIKIKLLTWGLVCIHAGCLFAQASATFKVIKAGGQVLSAVSHRQIKTGDQILGTDKITFESKDSYLHVASPDGRKTIRRVPDNSPREMQQLMRNFLSADKKLQSSRGTVSEGLEKIIHEMSYDTLLVLDKGRIELDSAGISLRKPGGVVAVYSLDDKKVQKRISDNTGFNLGKEILFGAAVPVPCPKISVIYMEDMDEPVFAPMRQLGSFIPLYADEVALRIELQSIIDSSKLLRWTHAQLLQEINSYLAAEYAPAIAENVRDWLVTRLMIK